MKLRFPNPRGKLRAFAKRLAAATSGAALVEIAVVMPLFTTLGMYGVDAFTPVINPPNVAILGVGKLTRRAVVTTVDGIDALSIRPMCYLTLTIDHRALDAFQANAFLTATVREITGWPKSRTGAAGRRND